MNAPFLVVCDIGDVLMATLPGAEYRQLARRTGIARSSIAQLVRASGIATALERGELGIEAFTEALRRLLNRPGLDVTDVEESWQAVLGGVDPTLAPVAARLAAAERLVLASNTNALHWPMVWHTLRQAGIDAPAYLSFQLGYIKPDRRFFTALLTDLPAALAEDAVFVDNRTDNVAAAIDCGMTGWLHRSPAATSAYLNTVLHAAPLPDREERDAYSGL